MPSSRSILGSYLQVGNAYSNSHWQLYRRRLRRRTLPAAGLGGRKTGGALGRSAPTGRPLDGHVDGR